MGIRLAVTTILPSRNAFIWFPAEFPQDTIEEVAEALADNGSILVQRLELEPAMAGSDKRIVRGRVPTIIGEAAVVTIAPMHVQLIEGA